MKQKRFAYIVIIVIAAVSAWAWLRYGGVVTKQIATIREAAREVVAEELQREILAPPPLRSEASAPRSSLTRAGTIQETNRARAAAGLAPLAENSQLNVAADLKVKDMFAKQYFAHESPTGEGPSEFIERAGYEYLVIGENLALGNFEDDRALVVAWMESPGHRENILHSRFTEIGVAVGRGQFDGKTVWLAVQEFGRPRSACPAPDAALRAKIESNQQDLDVRTAELNRRRAELEEMRSRHDSDYNAKVDEYNALVAEYNHLLEATKALVARYNTQVAATNACIQNQ